jgi:hypothetical protein
MNRQREAKAGIERKALTHRPAFAKTTPRCASLAKAQVLSLPENTHSLELAGLEIRDDLTSRDMT